MCFLELMRAEEASMKLIQPVVETILNDIKLIFLNPYHYTYVIQKQDNYIYLYDELTMDIVGKSKVSFNENFKMLAFTDNFNTFYSYIEAKPNTNQQQAQIIIFNLEQDGTIVHTRNQLIRKGVSQNLSLFNISYLERQKDRDPFIVGLGKNRIYFISIRGQIFKEFELKRDSRQLNLINGFALKQNKWIFIEESTVYFASIYFDHYRIDDYLHIKNKIASIFLDASIRGQFIAFITQMHTVIILVKSNQKWRISNRFQIPNLLIRKLCFFYPSVNTSTTNKFKDKLFLLIHGESYYLDRKLVNSMELEESSSDKIQKLPIPNQFLSQKALYIHEYSISELMMFKKSSFINPKSTYCIRDIGIIKYTIWANQHAQNCIRIFKEDKSIQNVDLISLIPGQYIGKQWVNLGYRFEPRSTNVLYEETENNFEKEKVQYRKITEEQLNDWSHSILPKEVMMRKSIKRLNCVNFD